MGRGRIRRAAVLALASVMALAVATTALGAHPLKGKHYSGHGTDYFNNTKSGSYTQRERGRRSKIRFDVSKDGRHVTGLRGYYDFYCGAGTSSITDKKLKISRHGTFSDTGSFPNKAPNGSVNGTVHVKLRGRFTGDGSAARVVYKVVIDFTGDTQRPCGTKVVGKVKAH